MIKMKILNFIRILRCYSISTIEHIPNYFKVIDEIYNSLKYWRVFIIDISYSEKDLINIYNVEKFLDYKHQVCQTVEKDYEL